MKVRVHGYTVTIAGGAAIYTLFTLAVPRNEKWTVKSFKAEADAKTAGELVILKDGSEQLRAGADGAERVHVNQEFGPGTIIDITINKIKVAAVLFGITVKFEVENV